MRVRHKIQAMLRSVRMIDGDPCWPTVTVGDPDATAPRDRRADRRSATTPKQQRRGRCVPGGGAAAGTDRKHARTGDSAENAELLVGDAAAGPRSAAATRGPRAPEGATAPGWPGVGPARGAVDRRHGPLGTAGRRRWPLVREMRRRRGVPDFGARATPPRHATEIVGSGPRRQLRMSLERMDVDRQGVAGLRANAA